MIKQSLIFIIFIGYTFLIGISSCQRSPVDRAIDQMESILSRMDKLAMEDNPTREEAMDLIADTKKMQTSYMTLDKGADKLSPAQLQRLSVDIAKLQNLPYDPKYQRLRQKLMQFHLQF